MPTLVELQARFLRREVRREKVRRVRPEVFAVKKSGPFEEGDIIEVDDDVVYMPAVDSLAEAQGISFLCPKCFNDPPVGPIGTHTVICWFEDKVPDDAQPGPGRWYPVGTGYRDLSFVPHKRSNSVLLQGGCGWHGFVTNGSAE